MKISGTDYLSALKYLDHDILDDLLDDLLDYVLDDLLDDLSEL